MMKTIFGSILAGSLLALPFSLSADPVGDVYETCPEADDVGYNVECYPLTFLSKTEVHPDGIPIIGYLFVPTDRPDEPLSAIVFAHGSGTMYSSNEHNKGLNSKHKQWVKQYTSELGYVSLHVSSFHSRYLLPDTDGDQRILEIDIPPEGPVGGDDYRATSTIVGASFDSKGNVKPYETRAFNPDEGDWKEANNKRAGVSEVMERAYDMDAAWDFLAGIRKGRMIDAGSRRNDDDAEPTLGTPMTEIGYIGEIINGGITVDHQKIFLYGTSHGGQTAMATAHLPRIENPDNPMNAEWPDSFPSPAIRYAAFFDYYGGCGLYGAYGGSGPDSTWRPYAPFIKFAGEYDDTVFDDDTVPIDSPEKFGNENCGKRFITAYNDPDFPNDILLEMIVYDDAFHSFDGVKQNEVAPDDDIGKGNFNDWLAKIHANYRITVPFMDAIGRLVNASRASETAPTPNGLGLSQLLPFFSLTTVPVDPNLPPRFLPDNPAFHDAILPVDLANVTLDLNTLFKDAFGGFYDISCKGFSLPDNVTINPLTCKLAISLSDDQLQNDMPMTFGISLATEKGTRYQPVTLESGEGTASSLQFKQAIQTLPAGAELSALNFGGLILDLRGFAWTEYPQVGAHIVNFEDLSPDAYSILDDDGEKLFMLGDHAPDDTPDTTAVTAAVGDWGVSFALDVSATESDRAVVSISDDLEGFNRNDGLFSSPATSGENPSTNFIALDSVSEDVPPPPGEFPNDGGEENQVPVADAGKDRAVMADQDVTLDGSDSSDAEDDATSLVFSWQQLDGTKVTLSGNDTATATFTAPGVDSDETLTFELTVTDTEGASDSDTIVITVNPPDPENTPPVAEAGKDRTVEAGDNVTLDATGSSDEEDDSEQLDFAWQQTGGTPVELSATDKAVVSFPAPAVDSVESLVFELTATDSGGLSSTDSVTIIVNPADDGDGDGGGDSSGGSGGGALLWLLPFTLLLRRRK